jgi:ketosteroid isomerase-like protein
MQAGKWKQAIEAFLDDYVAAFTASNGARIAHLYHAPCVTVRADGHSFQTESEAQAFFQRLADTYYRDGCRGWKYENLEVSPLGGRSAVATMDWQMQREDGSVIRRWRQSYNFVEIDGRLRILASTFHLP